MACKRPPGSAARTNFFKIGVWRIRSKSINPDSLTLWGRWTIPTEYTFVNLECLFTHYLAVEIALDSCPCRSPNRLAHIGVGNQSQHCFYQSVHVSGGDKDPIFTTADEFWHSA